MKRLYYVRCFVLAESEREARLYAMNFPDAEQMDADIATVNHVSDEGARDRLPVQHPASDNKQTCGELVGLANWLPPEEPPMNSRNLIMGLGLGSAVALMGGLSEATQDTPEADKEADEAQRQREQEQKAEAEWPMRSRAYETLRIAKMSTYQPEPRRRSKRAQRVKERGWRCGSN